ncbi:sulfatase family protein [Mongoliibacter ruber]|uniref:Arylsulfatase A-like enzyme n=1 Tax=Mongoliibacter ruber TaxID=1750599 RepID=A0A2T0WG90_9BACT|nr:sulfatase [Mongoliibacter ruber]PRY85719.1 arylsulfatase A-like enzyme [Mongoliibacter ruber]
MTYQKAFPLFIALFLYVSHAAFSQSAEKPNILWLSVEDISPMLEMYGDQSISTPNIDRLAKEGITYSRAYATVGVCAPSRSSIITGMYPVSIGSHNMRTGPHYAYREPEDETYRDYYAQKDIKGRNVPEYATVPPPFVKCFTEYLRAEGYYTSNNAKTDYQFNSPLTAWDEIGREATYKNRKVDQPFFAVFNHEITHESRIFMKKEDPMLADKNKVTLPEYFPDIPVVRQDVGRAYSNIMELDKQIGDMLKGLEDQGLLDKTIIFFWSDHGGPLLRQKRAVGNSGLHVPLIVRMPNGQMGGTKIDDIVSLMDLGPTVMSLAGIVPPDYMHGKAFLGPHKTKHPHQYAFGSADRFDEALDMSRSVIDGRYVYIRNFRPELPLIYRNEYREQIDMTKTLVEMDQKGELTGGAAYIFMKTKPLEELYDLSTDPDEIHNLSAAPEHQAKLKELRNALSAWQLEIGDLGFVPEYDLVNMMWPGMVQPETAPVEFVSEDAMLGLSSKTEGASIAFQIDSEIGGKYWSLYTEPLKLEKGQKIAARAVRIGYKTSDIGTFTNP